MRIKRLEIQGFKSFKDRTIVHFDHTITGIVGPNGCGKSNIVDAFFWVMGEQSYKHIRGTGSDDLIFNGSSKFNPSGLAEVTLVLETDEVDTANAPSGASAQDLPMPVKSTKEVSVTRRVYRGGEGEYFINGVHARLKDIQELFMDTGVGAKGYSVIEQGQIGKIVNAKPEDRRLLIEEAAGIAKYKARKKESLRKMESANENLARLNDIVVEIERNLGSLERQAQKARKYKEYKDELLNKEMTWGRRKHRILQAQKAENQSLREGLEHELVGRRAELQTAENEIEIGRTHHLTDSKEHDIIQQAIQHVSKDLTQEESARELLRRRQEDLAFQINSLETEAQELNHSIQSEQAQLSARENEMTVAESDLQGHAALCAEMDTKVREFRAKSDQTRQHLEALKNDLMRGISESSQLSSRMAALDAKAESHASQQQRFTHQEAELSVRAESMEAERAHAQSEFEGATQQKQSAQQILETSTQKIKDLEIAQQIVERDFSGAKQSLTQLQSRLESLEELAASYEGLGDGPRAALQWADDKGYSGQFKLVADVLEVDPEFQVGLESWFESRLENLILDPHAGGAQNGFDALKFLEESGKGRAVIQLGIADDVDGAANHGAKNVLGEAEAIRTVLNNAGLNAVDPMASHVRGMGAHAVEGVFFVESLAPLSAWISTQGFAAVQSALQGWSLVSAEGWVWQNATATLRGGSLQWDKAASLIGRRRAIQELKEQVEHADQRFQTVKFQLETVKQDLKTSQLARDEARERFQQLQVQSAAMERDLRQLERAVSEINSQQSALNRQRELIASEAAAVATERQEVGVKLQDVSARRIELENVLSEKDAGQAELTQQLRAQESSLQDLRVKEASARERASSLKREIEVARSFIQTRQRRYTEVVEIKERVQRQQQEQTGGDDEILEKIRTLTQNLGEKQTLLSEVKNRVEHWNASVQAALERVKALHKEIDQKSSGLNQAAIEAERITGELAHLIQNLEEKYGIGCLEIATHGAPIQEEMTEPVITVEMTEEEEKILAEEVEQLRDRIRRLGEVNPMALEEFEALKKRYDYLVSEREDLERSVKNLQEAIEHINQTSKDRFVKAFDAISKRFEQLFPVIFGGGRAQLSLVYPQKTTVDPLTGETVVASGEGEQDVLEAGVDILAQPPGKKIVNIGLLSGGEKALTAVSLIFAIFMVKPSPFCILDEVDAPLDDANIGRFNSMLKEMSSSTQFILITHNKKTMELNDTLYGVTMEDPGVSKMISIEMN